MLLDETAQRVAQVESGETAGSRANECDDTEPRHTDQKPSNPSGPPAIRCVPDPAARSGEADSNPPAQPETKPDKNAKAATNLQSLIEAKSRQGGSDDNSDPEQDPLLRLENLLCATAELLLDQHRELTDSQAEILKRLELLERPISETVTSESITEPIDSEVGEGNAPPAPKREERLQQEQANAWKKQRDELLQQYGSGPAPQTGTDPNKPPPTPTVDQVGPGEIDSDEIASNPASQHEPNDDSANVMHRADDHAELSSDAQELVKMREKLQARLRKAEVEISIERAKVARMKRDLELEKSQLDQRLKELESDEAAADASNQNGRRENDRLLSRISRWLPNLREN